MKPHILGDVDSNVDEVRQSEVHLNNLAKLWARGLDIGGNTDTNDRCKNALLSQFAKVPKMQGLRKDHKPDMEGDPTRGPPLRPLVSARSSPNAPCPT